MDNKTIGDFEENNILNIEAIIQTYNSYIYTILKNCISNKEDIEEVLSDVFMILWKNYEKIDKNIHIKPYLVGITRNLIRKRYRISNIICNLENIDDYENKVSNYIDIQNLMEKDEKSKIISTQIDNMKLEEKKIFIMFYYESKKIKEISKELSLSESKVKIILHRLRKVIKKKLKERGYDYGE
ncbi:MAG: sigma-70 family RNA polymerase sigma factor [Clostridia bacterium]|nr:sigma-70 family RNA polymerase sigma factor [Clostridia bacterium]